MPQENLVVSILCPIDQSCFPAVTDILQRHDCQLISTHTNTLGKTQVIFLYLTGNWDTITKTESSLQELSQTPSVTITITRTEDAEDEELLLTYHVNLIAIDNAAIPNNLIQFLKKNDCTLVDFTSTRYLSAHSPVLMQMMHATILIPADTNMADLREHFYDFSDLYNYEATLEPDRG